MYVYLVDLESKKLSDFLLTYSPIWIMLILILSLQYGVGTDYFTYLELADGSKGMGWIEAKSEFLFIWLVNLVKQIGISQVLFLLVAIIQVSFLALIAYEVRKMDCKLHHFFFLYFTLSLTFFNQFNGIRQYVAVYMIIYAIFNLIYNKKIKFIILVLLASLFHHSAILFLLLIPIRKILNKRLPVEGVIIGLLVLLVISSLDLTKYVNKILSYTPYRGYIGSKYFRRTPIQGIITKIPKLLITMFSAYLIKDQSLNDKEVSLLNLSYIANGVLILSFASTIIWRFYQYIDLFTIFPSLILFRSKSNKDMKLSIALLLFVILFVKIIILPRGEYLYRSILFR